MNWDGIISLLFACMEFLLLANLLFFAQKNRVNVFAMMIILVLGSYQLLEYFMCGLGTKTSFVAYISLSVISLLPALNLLMVLSFFKKYKTDHHLLFLPAVFFLIYYFIEVKQFVIVKCSVLYAAYNYPLGDLYGVFYYLPIVVSIVLLSSGYLKETEDKRKKLIVLLLLGHGVISLPVLTGFILKFAGEAFLVNIMESIMCKFALGYAVCLGIFVLNNKLNSNE